jgi:hypothetical protein
MIRLEHKIIFVRRPSARNYYGVRTFGAGKGTAQAVRIFVRFGHDIVNFRYSDDNSLSIWLAEDFKSPRGE